MDVPQLFPMVVSTLAMASSLGFWAFQKRREQPRLCAYANRLIVQGLGPATNEQPMTIANLSAMPDVLFKVRVWAKLPDGSWHPAKTMRVCEPSYLRPNVKLHTKLPINLAAHQTATMYVYIDFEAPLTELPEQFHYKVELTGLGGKVHLCEIARLPTPV